MHCKHGTYVGTPGGADRMCGYCESGEDPPTREELEDARKAVQLERLGRDYDRFTKVAESRSFREAVPIGAWWTVLTTIVDEHFTAIDDVLFP